MSFRILKPGDAAVIATSDGNLLIITNRDGRVTERRVEA